MFKDSLFMMMSGMVQILGFTIKFAKSWHDNLLFEVLALVAN